MPKRSRGKPTPTPKRIRVRMYQVGFGDAFLMSFEYAEKLPDGRDRRHILIDFGSTRAPKSPQKLETIAALIRDHTASEQEILKETRGEIDVVVVTHRHKDHLSAFASPGIAQMLCKPGYPKLVVRSWTENPRAARGARSLAARSADGSRAIAGRSMALEASLHEADVFAMAVAEKLRAVDSKSRSLAAKVKQMAEDQIANKAAVDQLEKWAKAGKGTYLHYGLPSGIESVVPGIVVRVLGPPTVDQHPAVLTQRYTDPQEFWMIYEGVLAQLRTADVLAGVKLIGQEASDTLQPEAAEDAEDEEDLAENGGATTDWPAPVPPHPAGPVGPVRWLTTRMGKQQLNSLLRIVRTMDGVLNNTSVILLFDVPRKNSKKVVRLLFPGDAQIENWEYALKCARKAAANKRMLREVDFYKVGHHGSRNATPRTLFNLWTEPDVKERPLVAMMSTKARVHGESASTRVPRKTLVAALDTRTNGHLYTSQNLSSKRPFVELELNLQTDAGFTEVVPPEPPAKGRPAAGRTSVLAKERRRQRPRGGTKQR
jgi:hypothetical protein